MSVAKKSVIVACEVAGQERARRGECAEAAVAESERKSKGNREVCACVCVCVRAV